MMNGHGQSDSVVVATKFANKDGQLETESTLAEQMEPSTLTEGCDEPRRIAESKSQEFAERGYVKTIECNS